MVEQHSATPQSEVVVTPPHAPINEILATIPDESLRRGFEARSVDIRSVLRFAGALAAAIVLLLIGLWWLLSTWQDQALAPHAQIVPVNPTIQPAPGAFPVVSATDNLQRVVKPALANLNSYGWVDQKAGVVHIPIDRAMTLLLQHGLPARNVPPSFGLDDAHRLESEGGQNPNDDFTLR